jgi:hypothetical protein
MRISREEVGRRLDLALTRQELNRPTAAAPVPQPQADKP